MEPVSFYLKGARARGGPVARSSSTGVPLREYVGGTAAQERILAMRKHRVEASLRPLNYAPWNGHLEVTDECLLGLATFEISRAPNAIIDASMPFRGRRVRRRVRVFPIGNSWGGTQVNLFRGFADISIADLMLERFTDESLEKYMSEYCLLGQLFRKIQGDRAVENR